MMAGGGGKHRRERAGDLHHAGGMDLGQVGAAVILAAALAHAATTFSPLPWWDMSPLVVTPSMNGMGPAQSLVTDAVLLIGAALVFIGEANRRARVHAAALVLAAIGVVGVVLHGWVLPSRGLANQAHGASWAAAVIAMVAMLHACRDVRTRRITIAVAAGFVVLLAIKGAQQTFVEHPRTVANFNENRDQILAAQGWTADSPMALGYERRLKQPDPSAWFGLSNVYASFMAAGAAALLAALIASIRRRGAASRWAIVVAAAALLAALGALGLTYSKGGVGALVLGVATVAGVTWCVGWRGNRDLGGTNTACPDGTSRGTWRPANLGGTLGGIAALAAVAAPIVAVLVRGPIGERLGDRSLLFRWYYWQGAARIAADHPIAGVGPAGFQEAYLSARPPLSVEEVTSPHGLPFDWWATLGLFGLAWVALFVLVVWWIGRAAGETAPAALEPNPESPANHANPDAARRESRLAFMIAAVVALLGTWLDMQVVLPHGPTVTIDRAAVWLVGLMAWWGATAAMIRIGRAAPAATTAAAVAGAVVLAIHAQIEVTPVQGGSAALFFVLLGTAAARPSAEPGGRRERAVSVSAAALTGGLVLLIASSAWRARAWQGSLREAAEILAPVPDIRTRLSVPASEPDAARLRADALADLGRLVGRPVDTAEPWLMRLQLSRIPPAVDALRRAESLFGDQWKVRRAGAWLLLDAAASVRGADQAASDRFITEATQMLAPSGGEAGFDEARTGSLRAYAMLLEHVAAMTGEDGTLERAVAVLEEVADRDPYDLPLAVDLAKRHAALNHPEEAARWAARALELEQFKRLDPEVHGLGKADREAMRGLTNP